MSNSYSQNQQPNYSYTDLDDSKFSIIIKIFILFIPFVNIVASFVWSFAGENPQTKMIGRIAFGFFSAITIWAIWYGISGLEAMIELVESLAR